MSKIVTALSLLKNNRSEFIASCIQKCNFLFDDITYLKLLYRYKIGKSLNLENPQTFNEKLQWLKLYNHRLEYKVMVDKYEVKKYVSQIIGDEYVIPTYGCWDDIGKIDWKSLPLQFVIKTTHGGGGGGIVVCKDKKQFDIKQAERILRRSMKQDIYKDLREWPYKDMKKRIIAEKLLSEEGQDSPHDYKVMCFNGKVKLIEFHEGRYSERHTQDFYDREWNLTPITQGSYGEYNTTPAPKPELLDKMIHLSEILAKGIPHVRVDWYIVENHLYFGELTFFDGSGLCPWDKYEDDLLMGSWITLPEKTIETKSSKGFGNEGIDMFY